MEGTIREVEDIKRSSKKRKSDVLDNTTEHQTPMDTEPEIETSTAEFEQAGAFFAFRDKDEKRRHRAEKMDPVEEFRQMGDYLGVQAQKKKKKKRTPRLEVIQSPVDAPHETDQPQEDDDNRVETRDERRERRQRRREEKEQKRKALAALENQQHLIRGSSSIRWLLQRLLGRASEERQKRLAQHRRIANVMRPRRGSHFC